MTMCKACGRVLTDEELLLDDELCRTDLAYSNLYLKEMESDWHKKLRNSDNNTVNMWNKILDEIDKEEQRFLGDEE